MEEVKAIANWAAKMMKPRTQDEQMIGKMSPRFPEPALLRSAQSIL